MNLNEEEFNLLKDFHHYLFNEFPTPDLLIFLDRNIDSLYTNIRRRNRSYELNMDLNYLKKLDYYYENWLEKLNIPIMRIDADTIDLNNPEFLSLRFKQLLNLDFPKTQRVVKLALT